MIDFDSSSRAFARKGYGESDAWKEQAFQLRGQRQALIAQNIANANTPVYKARDVAFAKALERADRDLRQLTMQRTSADHLSAAPASMAKSTMDIAAYVRPDQASLDGNTVSMDREREVFAKNAVQYEAAMLAFSDEAEEFNLATRLNTVA